MALVTVLSTISWWHLFVLLHSSITFHGGKFESSVAAAPIQCSMHFSCRFIPWIIACEVFPLKIKGENRILSYIIVTHIIHIVLTGIALAILFSCYWVFSSAATFYTPRLVGPPLYLHGYMYFSAFIYLLATLLVLLAIPETKVSLTLMT